MTQIGSDIRWQIVWEIKRLTTKETPYLKCCQLNALITAVRLFDNVTITSFVSSKGFFFTEPSKGIQVVIIDDCVRKRTGFFLQFEKKLPKKYSEDVFVSMGENFGPEFPGPCRV